MMLYDQCRGSGVALPVTTGFIAEDSARAQQLSSLTQQQMGLACLCFRFQGKTIGRVASLELRDSLRRYSLRGHHTRWSAMLGARRAAEQGAGRFVSTGKDDALLIYCVGAFLRWRV